MSQSRNRWLVNIILIAAVISFIGFSIVPLLNASFKQNQPSPIASSPSSQTPNGGETAKLEEQAHGYELVLQREPENQTALQGLAQARIQLRDFKGAIAPMEKLVASNPNQTEYKLLLAQLKQHNGDREGAIQSYRSILATKPGDLTAIKGAVGLLLQQNHPEEAITLLQDTLKTVGPNQKPGSADATTVELILAQVYASQKRYDEAASALQNTLSNQKNQAQPSSVDTASVQLMLVQIYTIQKRYEQAIELCDKAIAANKQDFRPVLAKAFVFKQEGKTEQAKLLFQNATALAPAEYKDKINQMGAPEPAAPTTTPTVAPTAETTTPTAPK